EFSWNRLCYLLTLYWGITPPPGTSCNNDFFFLWTCEALWYDIRKVNPKRTIDVGSFQVNPDGTQERTAVPSQELPNSGFI
uniref:Uncharacterized protein n=1 Tax=Cyanistes caeruleus TaxID=156563 RepID=A0A8C0U4I8_CYACU